MDATQRKLNCKPMSRIEKGENKRIIKVAVRSEFQDEFFLSNIMHRNNEAIINVALTVEAFQPVMNAYINKIIKLITIRSLYAPPKFKGNRSHNMMPPIMATCIPLNANICEMPASANKSLVSGSKYALSPRSIVIKKFWVGL